MVHIRELILCSLLLALRASASLYPKASAVLQLDANSFDKEILQSSHAAVVEFYAPWCGHCKNLAPAYEKVATSLKGLAKVAAVNCDQEKNKALCGSQGVQGFPTIKIFKPRNKPGKPIAEDYQGPRTAKAIVDAVVDKIPNHVDRVTSFKEFEKFLSDRNDTAKAILFTSKGTIPALYKALAIDFLGSIKFAQIRDNEKEAAKLFGVTEYPKLIVLPGGQAPGKVYEGNMKRDPLFEFLKSIANPTQQQATSDTKKKPKEKSTKTSAKSDQKGTVISEASLSAGTPHSTRETPRDTWIISDLVNEISLADSCFSRRSHICILAIVEPSPQDEAADPKFASINEAFQSRKGLKFYKVSALSDHGKALVDKLGLSKEIPTLVAVNGSKRWYKKFKGDATNKNDIVDWLDAIKMGEGKKEKLPAGYLEQTPETQSKEPLAKGSTATPGAEPEQSPVEAAKEPESAKEHDEL